MIDFDKIAEMSFLVLEMDQILFFDNGLIVNKENFGEFITSQFDA